MTDRKEDFLLMSEIANRGLGFGAGPKKLDLMMDIEYTNDVIPLDLEKFLAFDDGDFGHDIFGIVANFNRTTLQMDNSFLPRCALPSKEERVNEKLTGLALAVANEATTTEDDHSDCSYCKGPEFAAAR